MKRYKTLQLPDDRWAYRVIADDDLRPFIDFKAAIDDLRSCLENEGAHRLKYVFPK